MASDADAEPGNGVPARRTPVMTFIRRHRFAIVIGVVLLVAVLAA